MLQNILKITSTLYYCCYCWFVCQAKIIFDVVFVVDAVFCFKLVLGVLLLFLLLLLFCFCFLTKAGPPETFNRFDLLSLHVRCN